MINKSFIEEVINEYLDGGDKFLIDVKVRTGNIITIVIDSDSEVSIDDCVNISKFLESKLDRDNDDFELKVSSAGVGSSLVDKRQYKKNMGRFIKVLLETDDMVAGELTDVREDSILVKTLPTKRKKGQSKADVLEERELQFADIKDAKIEIVF